MIYQGTVRSDRNPEMMKLTFRTTHSSSCALPYLYRGPVVVRLLLLARTTPSDVTAGRKPGYCSASSPVRGISRAPKSRKGSGSEGSGSTSKSAACGARDGAEVQVEMSGEKPWYDSIRH
ncbi:hypothetical protein PM082_022540 [Marasmius tenuissimus]|nr:hypothetical protein PM082_022540 [Marasmius tenuissimus]